MADARSNKVDPPSPPIIFQAGSSIPAPAYTLTGAPPRHHRQARAEAERAAAAAASEMTRLRAELGRAAARLVAPPPPCADTVTDEQGRQRRFEQVRPRRSAGRRPYVKEDGGGCGSWRWLEMAVVGETL